MTVNVGVDLGTTYTAAAVHRDGRTEMVELGNRANSVPSVVFAPAEGELVVGEAAVRRAMGDPRRVAREYKRRIGDPTPILLGGEPHTAEALTAAMLRWVIAHVTERSGEAPRHVVVAYPANWGAYKQDLLRDAIADAGLSNIDVITEPEAAVVHYASQERVTEGTTIGVYDLGGGTFDAAIVRKTPTGVELLGEPEGIERLGGIDFDEAVFAHVVRSLGDAMPQLDAADDATLGAVMRLRQECVAAKEALSSDTEVSIPVLLPGLNTQVRLTRSEFEAMVRPPIASSIAAFQRALRSADLAPSDLDAVLLVGGSSRIPLVAEMVGAELGRPVAVDAHPKHAVALGAALAASASGEHAAPVSPVSPPPVVPTPVVSEPVAAPPVKPAPVEPTAVAPVVEPVVATPAASPADASQLPTEPIAVVAPPRAVPQDSDRSGPPWVLIAALVLLAGVAAAAFVVFSGGDDGSNLATEDNGVTVNPTATPDSAAEPIAVPDPTATTAPEPDPTATSIPQPTATVAPIPTSTPPPVCPADAERCIEILSVAVQGDAVVVDWQANFAPATDSFHAHFFWDTFEPTQVGANFADFGVTRGDWELTADQPWASEPAFLAGRPADARQICVTVATAAHLVDDPTLHDCQDLP